MLWATRLIASVHWICEFIATLSLSAFPLMFSTYSPLYQLSYAPAYNRVYLMDKDLNVYTYRLSLPMVERQIAMIRDERSREHSNIYVSDGSVIDVSLSEGLEKGAIGREGQGRLARILEGRDLEELALKIATNRTVSSNWHCNWMISNHAEAESEVTTTATVPSTFPEPETETEGVSK
jgi:hypothetical protein